MEKLISSHHNPSLREVGAGIQGWDLDVEAEAETTEHCLTATCPPFLYSPGSPVLWMTPLTVG